MCEQCKAAGNPYGADRPSPLARPGGFGAEIVPKPGLPATYPSYLKPIPVNTRDIERALNEHINSASPKIRRWLYSTWTAEADAIKYQEITNAIRDGEVPAAWITRWQEDYAAFVNDTLDPAWRSAQRAGGSYMQAAIKKRFGVVVAFPDVAERLETWIDHRAAEMAVNLSEAQTLACRNVIRHLGVDGGLGPQELARYLRPVIGLTPKEEAAVRAYRAKLIEAKTAPKKIDQLVGNYTGFLHRRRADRIAETELSFAHNFGQLEEMRQARDTGAILDPIVKRWLTAKNERTCEFCRGMDGKIVGLEETFPGHTQRLQNTLAPPAHPKCRCTLLYEIAAVNGVANVRQPAAT